MKIKIIIRYHHTATRMAKIQKPSTPSANEDVKQLELAYAAARKLKWYKQSGEQFGRFLKSPTDTCHESHQFYSQVLGQEK